MTKFIIGLLLGLILGIGGTAAFLISAGGGDYLVVTSPRVRELETSLKQADQEREWLRGQLRASNEILVKLESRFIALATRFEDLGSQAATLLGAPPKTPEGDSAEPAATTTDAASPPRTEPADESPAGDATPEPTESASDHEDGEVAPTDVAKTEAAWDAGTPTPSAEESPEADSGEHDETAASPGDG